jgi:anaphase-promoting complex subunit 3
MGRAYLARSEQKFKEARDHLKELPQNQQETGWVLNEIARCYFDEQKNHDALEVYKWIQQLEPYRLTGMEYYSTCLWRKEDTVALAGTLFSF